MLSPIYAGGQMNFDIKTEQLGDDAYLISLTGEVDLHTAPEFKKEPLDAISQGAKQVSVDCSETTLIESSTPGRVVGGAHRPHRHPCQRARTSPHPHLA